MKTSAAQQTLFDEDLQRHQDLDFFIRFGQAHGWIFSGHYDTCVHWEKGQRRNQHFPSQVRFYEKYGEQISSIEQHSNYLLRSWLRAKRNDPTFKRYYQKKLLSIFFKISLKYKIFALAPDLVYRIWKRFFHIE